MELETEGPLFTDAEADFLLEQLLGRIATVSREGQPHIVPVAYEFDGKYLYFCGQNLTKTVEFRQMAREPRIAFVVDDVVSIRPWRSRGIEIKGVAELLEADRRPYIRITPRTKASWGLGT